MQPLLAIAALTWKAAFRFRLFWVLATLLLLTVIGLPLLIKDDGTARGFTQILLTYTLSVITALLGLATLWLACGTLARDIEDHQLEVVAVKPIPRWQIWLGKWLGIMALNLVLLTLAGACVYTLMQWRARRLPANEQQILRNEVLVARGSLKEKPLDIEAEVDRILRERLRSTPADKANEPYIREQLRQQLQVSVVPPNMLRRWTLHLGSRKDNLRDQPLFVRFKFHAAQTNVAGTYLGVLEVGPPETPARRSTLRSFAANTFHEVTIPPNLFDAAGTLTVDFQNRDNITLIFPLNEGMEVLYREAGFALNFSRGLMIILCWLGLVASVGLTSASFLSFPVAAFFSASLLLVALSSGTLSSAVEEGTIMGFDESGQAGRSPFDVVLIPFFRLLVKVLGLVQRFSPVDALSTGRSIHWSQVGLAALQIVVLVGGVIAAIGMIVFTRRELATAQGNS